LKASLQGSAGGCPGRPSSSFSAPFDPRRSPGTHFHKYDNVCWARDGAQIQARRRVDVETSARRSNKELGPSRPNPSGGWGLRAISLSLVVVDIPDIASSSLRDLASQDPSANVTVFLKGSTLLRLRSKRLCGLDLDLPEHPPAEPWSEAFK